MGNGMSFLGGVGAGAGLVYLLDPAQGRRRRALARDQAVHLWHDAADATGVAGRDLGHRAAGLRALAGGHAAPDDDTLVARVRARLGRAVSHPRAVAVAAAGGRVTLSGKVLAAEAAGLRAAVAAVPGVAGVDDRLDVRDQAGNDPELQGGASRPGERGEPAQGNWSPAVRALAVAAGAGLLAHCTASRSPLAAACGVAGVGLALRGLTGTPLGTLVGLTGGRRAVGFHKTLTIDGPVERVFPFFSRYENWPRFMAHLREVRDLGNGRSHWVARGPAGAPVSWDAVETAREPNRVIAWASVPGSLIANDGALRFEPAGDQTRVTIHFHYTPPGGALGHFAATLFGANVKGMMDDDLVRLKGLIEFGRSAAPGKGVVSRQEVAAGDGRGR